MDLVRESEFRPDMGAQKFGMSLTPLIILFIVVGAISLGAPYLIYRIAQQGVVAAIGATFILGIVWLVFTFLWLQFVQTFRRLLRMDRSVVVVSWPKVSLRIRHLLNAHHETAEPSWLVLNESDIEWFRLLKETRIVPQTRGHGYQFFKFFEFKVRLTSEQMDRLEAVIAREDSLSQNVFKGLQSTMRASLFKIDKPGMTLRWWIDSLSPGYKSLARHLELHVRREEDAKVVHDYRKSISDEDILKLINDGQNMDAIKLLRLHKAMSLTEAKVFVDQLSRTGTKN